MLSVARFELVQQLRSHVFWVVFLLSAAMVGGAIGIEALRVGMAGADSPAAWVIRAHQIWTLFYLFTAAAFAGEAVLRDRQTGMAELVRATPAPAAGYALGRFLGATAAVLLCFLSVPLALAVGLAWRGTPASPALLGWAYAVLAAPNLLLGSALFFGLATATGRMSMGLVGAVALLTLYGLAEGAGAPLPPLAEPFGFAALATGESLWLHRLLWTAVALLLAAAGILGYARRPVGAAPRTAAIADPARAPRADPRSGQPMPRPRRPSPLTQLRVRLGFELTQTIATPVFAALLLLGIANTVARLWGPAAAGEGMAALLIRLIDAFQLVPIAIALFFAGELFWREQESGIDALIDAAPAPGAILYLAKLGALAALLAALALGTAATAALVAMLRGGAADWGLALTGYALPKAWEWILFGIATLAIQSVSASKLAGWGFTILYLIGLLAVDQLGWEAPWLRIGGYPGAPVPPELSGAAGVGGWRIGWSAAALLLVALGCLAAERRRAAQR